MEEMTKIEEQDTKMETQGKISSMVIFIKGNFKVIHLLPNSSRQTTWLVSLPRSSTPKQFLTLQNPIWIFCSSGSTLATTQPSLVTTILGLVRNSFLLHF